MDVFLFVILSFSVVESEIKFNIVVMEIVDENGLLCQRLFDDVILIRYSNFFHFQAKILSLPNSLKWYVRSMPLKPGLAMSNNDTQNQRQQNQLLTYFDMSTTSQNL